MADVNLQPIYIPVATINFYYEVTIFATGGTSPYVYSLTGTLPDGVTFDTATGVLAGTPTVSGNWPFVVSATDNNGYTGSRGYSLLVNFEPPSDPAPNDVVRVTVAGVELSQSEFTVLSRDPVSVELVAPPPAGVEVTVYVERGVNWYAPGLDTPSNGIPLQLQTTPAANFLNGL